MSIKYQDGLFWELDQDIIDHVLTDQDELVFAYLDMLIFLVL